MRSRAYGVILLTVSLLLYGLAWTVEKTAR